MRRKIVAVLLAVTMLSAGLYGCGNSGSQGSGSGGQGSSGEQSKDEGADKAAADEGAGSSTEGGEATGSSKYQTTYGAKQFDDVTITVELFDRSNAPNGSTITENKWTEYVNEQMNKVGITVEFVPVPRNDEVPKMQTMVAGGTAPDITLTYTYSYAEDYYNDGGVWDLSEFIDGEDQAQNMKAYIGQDVLDIGRNADGDLYGIVAKRATTAKTNQFIRKDWLDALGLEMPTTPDELYNVIEEMVNENPDGRTDVIGGYEQMYNNLNIAFSECALDETEWYISRGQDVIAEYYDPGMREYWRFMNKMYNNGLLRKDYYSLTEDDRKSDFVTGKVAYFESNVNYAVDVLRGSLLKTLQENVPTADMVSLPTLKNVNDGNVYSAAYALGGLIAFCPKTASEEKVEACMTYLDWQCTQEGGFVLYHGFEGEHYDFDENGVPVVKDAEYNTTDKDWIRTDLFLVGNQGYFATVDDFNACTSKEAPGYEEHVMDNYENSIVGTIRNDPYWTSPSTPDLLTDLNLIKDEYQVTVCTCSEAEFDAKYDEYMKALEDAGMQTIIDERVAYYKGN